MNLRYEFMLLAMTIDLEKEIEEIRKKYADETAVFVLPELNFVKDTVEGGERVVNANSEQLVNAVRLETALSEEAQIMKLRAHIDQIT